MLQPLNGVEGKDALSDTPNRFASLGVIHIKSFGLEEL